MARGLKITNDDLTVALDSDATFQRVIYEETYEEDANTTDTENDFDDTRGFVTIELGANGYLYFEIDRVVDADWNNSTKVLTITPTGGVKAIPQSETYSYTRMIHTK